MNIEKLPTEVMSGIYHQLPPSATVIFPQVSKHFQNISQYEEKFYQKNYKKVCEFTSSPQILLSSIYISQFSCPCSLFVCLLAMGLEGIQIGLGGGGGAPAASTQAAPAAAEAKGIMI